jgi:hypothetical protein
MDILTGRIRDIQHKYSAEQVFAAAENAVTDFRFPPEVFTRDVADLRAVNSLAQLVQDRQSSRAKTRFNPSRCQRVFLEDPEFHILMSIASEGVRIDTDPWFACCNTPDRVRQIKTQLPHTLAFPALGRNGPFLCA